MIFSLAMDPMGIGALKPGYEELEYGNNLVEAGGPIETLLTGTIGLILIFIYRRSFKNSLSLSIKQWLYIFLALFWLRPSFNLVFWVIGYLTNGRFSRGGDELWIAEALGWPNGTILIITGIIGIAVLLIIIFKFIPPTQRLSFIAAGLIGGLLGFAIWFGGVGELLIP